MSNFFHALTAPLRWIVNAPVRSAGISGVVLAWIGLLSNIGGCQQYVCKYSWLRPGCSQTGLGGVAGPEEQKLWDQVSSAQTCDGYRRYIHNYGKGEYVVVANARLTAARRIERQRWKAEDRVLPLSVIPSLEGAESDAEARSAALAAGRDDATRLLCTPYISGEFRLTGVDVAADRWTCREHDGISCGFDGHAVCHVQVRTIDVDEDCAGGRS